MLTALMNIRPLALLFASLMLWAVLVTVEGMRRLGWLRGEYARKGIHIGAGLALASLPVLLTRKEIVAVCALFFIGIVCLSGILHWFKAIEDIKRWTLGQYIYPIAVMLVAIIWRDPFIYSFAVIELALADGFAAIIGKWQGETHYHIFGGDKTYLGSLTFFGITLGLFLTYLLIVVGFSHSGLAVVLLASVVLTVLEGAITGGFDNLAVPLTAGLFLSILG